MQVRANGIGINYELSGGEDAPVIMFSHSLGSNRLMWEPQMEAFRARYQVLRYDTRGHGNSEAPEGAYTLDQLGADAVGLLDALGIEKVHWVGLSMGGMIGQNVALNHPERLLSLALCDTAAAIPEEARPLFQERMDTARKAGMQALVQETLERWFTPPFVARKSQEVERIRKCLLETPLAGFIGCTEAIKTLNYMERLSEIQMPTLIIVGEEDPGTPVAVARAMHERIAGSILTVLPSAAHLSNIEQAEAFNRTLDAFLGDL
ncbi:3-oxoadipate enol-lactonase [Thermodesulfobacteriota bacterium]